MHTRFPLLIATFILLCTGCKTDITKFDAELRSADALHKTVKKLTDVIVHDIFSPPVASRIYAYPSIAAYQTLRHDYPSYKSLAGQLTDLSEAPLPDTTDANLYLPIAAIHAYFVVGRQLIFSEDKMDEYQQELREYYTDHGVPSSVLKTSQAYGDKVAKHILDWADKDNYKQTRTFPKYSITSDPEKWIPTPPGYMDGIEPSWNKIRPFVLESAEQFVPPPPTPFDTDKNSTFYKEMIEVYDAVKDANEEEKEIASFWDCNPYMINVVGHVMHATKKITPGGHWVNITGLVCDMKDADIMKSMEAYALTTIALADGFISCWDEKYRSNLIRPETVINQYLDDDWQPLLQTPPFPEYTSGHSVISRAAAVSLTSIFGDNFAFDDDTEVEFGLPVRSFKSFYHASEEAAVSRLYGGIHYRPAIDYGVEQGQKVGDFIVSKLDFQ